MILSVKGKFAKQTVAGKFLKGFPSQLEVRALAMFAAMDAAVDLEDLRFPPGNHLQSLSGNRAGQHSVRINRQWRICFIWTPQGPSNVEIVDYH